MSAFQTALLTNSRPPLLHPRLSAFLQFLRKFALQSDLRPFPVEDIYWNDYCHSQTGQNRTWIDQMSILTTHVLIDCSTIVQSKFPNMAQSYTYMDEHTAQQYRPRSPLQDHFRQWRTRRMDRRRQSYNQSSFCILHSLRCQQW